MFSDLRAFIDHLERRGELVRVKTEIDPDQEITIVQHRVIAAGGPALLFENVKGSPYRIVSNLFGTRRRVAMACGEPPHLLGERVARVMHQLMPPSLGNLWRSRRELKRLLPARMRNVHSGPVLETRFQPPDLHRLPVLTCWPEDGGPFFTLPLVHTTDPENGQGNLGIYRLLDFGAIAGRPLLLLGVLLIVLGIQTLSLGLLGEIIIFTHARSIRDYQVAEVIERHDEAPVDRAHTP